MIQDAVLSQCVQNIHSRIKEKMQGLAANRFEQLYEVGRLQGQVDGLKEALDCLSNALEEYDK